MNHLSYFIFILNFRAVRNLHQLVLRQQKVDREESQDAEDPIKRVRQQLDKVKLFLESSVTYPEIWRCAYPAGRVRRVRVQNF